MMAGARDLPLGAAATARQEGITLVELLVGMAIMGVITAMLLAGWFALSKS